MAGGVVLETIQTKKLLGFVIILLLLQVLGFLFGGLIAPNPANVQQILSTKCKLRDGLSTSPFIYLRPNLSKPFANCEHASYDDKGIDENSIVFVAQFPLPREGIDLDMSRWFQYILAVLDLEIVYQEGYKMAEKPTLLLEVKLGYRDRNDKSNDWKMIAMSEEKRDLICQKPTKPQNGYQYRCDIMALFELGSCHHDYYLVNIKLPPKGNYNTGISKLDDLSIIVIHQNGGFTKVWLSLKTVCFPIVIAALIWFSRRVKQLQRSPSILEKFLFGLGVALSFLNMPIDWFTLWFDMPFMMLYQDIRQGIFYTMLMAFWVVFCGEHMMDQIDRNRITAYWKHLSAVAFGCLCLFVFELCERGVQLNNPFYSIWVTETGRNLALSFIILAGIAGGLYVLMICYLLFLVYRNINSKRTALPHMSANRRRYYSGLIYRFKVVVATTFVCILLTVVFYVVSQVKESSGRFDEDEHLLEYVSAFFTGVYVMWNLYVFALLILYAPSGTMPNIEETENLAAEIADDNDVVEHIEFQSLQRETSAIAALAAKATID